VSLEVLRMPIASGLRGQRVLVTAASQGIGFGTAKAFLEEGARVVINGSHSDRLAAAVRKLAPTGEVHGVVANLADGRDLDRLVAETCAHLGGIDVLAYVTGSPAPGTVMELDFEQWQRAAMLLTVSPAYLARKVAERMLADRVAGRLVFLASFAIREPIPNIAASNVCRIAIAGLVRTLARELGSRGIRVNGILPGYIETERVVEVFRDSAKRRNSTAEQVQRELVQEIPLGRIGRPEELARVAVFLSSELSSYVNGALLPVDGGILRSVG
jgi:3-oxoacyl-[acyl-carrier protein] reductase